MLPEILVVFVTKVLLVVYGYLSFKAIDSNDSSDDTQWLTFWFVYVIFNFLEFFFDYTLFWIPLYNELKLALFIWCGFFKGAVIIYNQVLKPVLKTHESKIDGYVNQASNKVKKALNK